MAYDPRFPAVFCLSDDGSLAAINVGAYAFVQASHGNQSLLDLVNFVHSRAEAMSKNEALEFLAACDATWALAEDCGTPHCQCLRNKALAEFLEQLSGEAISRKT